MAMMVERVIQAGRPQSAEVLRILLAGIGIRVSRAQAKAWWVWYHGCHSGKD